MPLPEHFFISDDGGSLHDTREALWASKPIRTNYRRTHGRIDSVADLKATLRAGEYAWPGGYPMFLIMGDGEALSFDSARANFRELVAAFAEPHCRGDWRVVACEINYEDSDLVCSHSGEPIPSAYGEESAE